MELELMTKADFNLFKSEIVEEIKKLITSPVEQNDWLKSSGVTKLLDCSAGTLQNLRVNGKLPFTKMGGTIYYSRQDVLKVLENNKYNIS